MLASLCILCIFDRTVAVTSRVLTALVVQQTVNIFTYAWSQNWILKKSFSHTFLDIDELIITTDK